MNVGTVTRVADGPAAWVQLDSTPGYAVGPCEVTAAARPVALGDRVAVGELGAGDYIVVGRIGDPPPTPDLGMREQAWARCSAAVAIGPAAGAPTFTAVSWTLDSVGGDDPPALNGGGQLVLGVGYWLVSLAGAVTAPAAESIALQMQASGSVWVPLVNYWPTSKAGHTTTGLRVDEPNVTYASVINVAFAGLTVGRTVLAALGVSRIGAPHPDAIFPGGAVLV